MIYDTEFHTARVKSNGWRSFFLSALGAVLGIILYVGLIERYVSPAFSATPAGFAAQGRPVSLLIDTGFNQNSFIYAAEKTVNGVVHVKTKAEVPVGYNNPLYEFFYGTPMPRSEVREGFGSGVIVTANGYIVTNNHVIDNSTEIEVVLNDKRKYTATLVGKDPSTDIALLKIDGKDFPFIPYGNSEDVRIGEWVLAVGNPFNLTSSVTAGIVSAKGRNLEILNDKYRIESFIQTDAALNPGNSGGALVNLKGELIGINTAILSPSGAYAGNSFAVPVSIVQKVVSDLIEFGEVQRAILGITIKTVDADLAKKKDLPEIKGVYVEEVKPGGAADQAGMKSGDIILEINNHSVNSTAEIQEQVSRYRPGEKVTVKALHNGEKKLYTVTLQNLYGNAEIVKPGETISLYGAQFAEVPADVKQKLGIDYGVRVAKLSDGKFKSAGIEQGFIIVKVNNKYVKSIPDLSALLKGIKGGVYIEGIYPNGTIAYYAFGV